MKEGVLIGRTAGKAPWGYDWLGGLIADVAVRERAWPTTLLALMRAMTPQEIERVRRSKAQF